MRPGEPPFAQQQSNKQHFNNESDEDEPHFDYPIPDRSNKKMPPQMNLLKRSVCTITRILALLTSRTYSSLRLEMTFKISVIK